MELKVVALLAVVALSCAASVEQEVAHQKGEIEYRFSFKTRSKPPANGLRYTAEEKMAQQRLSSTAKCSIELIGKDGSTTGPQELIDHPGQTKKGKVWHKGIGMIQVAKITAANVGEIAEVKLTSDNKDPWSCQWLKINTNDFHSGLGNGIYYTSIPNAVSKRKPAAVNVKGCPGGNCLHRCKANFCMKAEKRLLAEGEDEPPTHEHGGHFGPLGEGMPGTEHDSTMTSGHFMREFYQMENLDDDDEDYLRTHALF